MPTVALNEDTWTEVVKAGGNSMKQVVMRFGHAEWRFVDSRYPAQPTQRMSLISRGYPEPGAAYVPGPVGLEARAIGGPAIMYYGDYGVGG